MILNVIAAKLKRWAKGDFRGRHFEVALIVQAVSWYLSYRDIEEMLLKRGLEADHSTVSRFAERAQPTLDQRSIGEHPAPSAPDADVGLIDANRPAVRYLYRAIDKHGEAVDFLLTAKRDLDTAKRFFRKMLKEEPLLPPDRIGTNGAGTYPPAIAAARADALLACSPVHYVTFWNGATDDPGLRGDAVAAQGLRLRWRLDRSRAEPTPRVLLRTSRMGNQVICGSRQDLRQARLTRSRTTSAVRGGCR